MKKRRHHYVWRDYLRPWAKDEQIWCSRDGKNFKTNLMNIGQEKDFYKLKRVSKEGLQNLKRVYIESSPEPIKEILEGWVNAFTSVFEIEDTSRNHKIQDENFEKGLDILIHNLEEDLHCAIESSAIDILKEVRDGDLSFFYEDESKAIDFIYYLCVQYFRTSNMRDLAIASTPDTIDIDIKNSWSILRHILSTKLGMGIYRNKDDYNLVLLRNKTSTDLITGDQPIINTHATPRDDLSPVEAFEIYYPVSPNLAVLMSEDASYCEGEVIYLNVQSVNDYNQKILAQSHTQIYSSEELTT